MEESRQEYIKEAKEMNRDEIMFRLSNNEAQKHSLNIKAQSDVNQFGREQFDLMEAQRDLTMLGNILIDRLKEIDYTEKDIVTFYYKKQPLFERKMKPEELNKITVNDFITFENDRYMVYGKLWNADDDIMYIMLESEADMNARYK